MRAKLRRQVEISGVVSQVLGSRHQRQLVRLGAKPYVKEGPWWGQRYRKASLMDMTCYVGFKNLLIGATLFLTLKSMGLLVI